jgi:hypothetical protein
MTAVMTAAVCQAGPRVDDPFGSFTKRLANCAETPNT